MGQGAEQGHLPVSRADSVPRRARARSCSSTTTRSTRRRRARARTSSSARTTGCRTRACSTSRRASTGTPEVLIDPNTWSADGDVAAAVFAPSKDAKYAVYGISQSGSDWQDYKVMELATKKTLPDTRRVGEGLGRRVARRRLLLQPLSGAGEGPREGLDQREPSGLLPPARHAAVRRTSSSTRTAPTRSASTSSTTTDDERFAILSDLRARQGQGRQRALRPRSLECRDGDVHAARRRRSATTRSTSSTMSATSCWSRPTARRRTAASCSSIRSARTKRTGRRPAGAARAARERRPRPAASSSRPI